MTPTPEAHAMAQARQFLAFADSLEQHEFPTSPEQRRRALEALVRLTVQVMLTGNLTATARGDATAFHFAPEALFDQPLTRSGQTYDQLVRMAPCTETIPLDGGLLFTAPWSQERYRRALLRSGPGWRSTTWAPQEDQSSFLYLPWRLVYVDAGNHSAASGFLLRDGMLRPDVAYDLSAVLREVQLTDQGIARRDDGRIVGRSREWPVLALLGLGQRLLSL